MTLMEYIECVGRGCEGTVWQMCRWETVVDKEQWLNRDCEKRACWVLGYMWIVHIVMLSSGCPRKKTSLFPSFLVFSTIVRAIHPCVSYDWKSGGGN